MKELKKSAKTLALITLIALSISGIAIQPVMADGGTLYVGTEGTNSAVTYDTIEEAVSNASANDTIEIAPGTYNESVEIVVDNLTITNYNSTAGDVTIDATEEDYGDALFGEFAHNVTIGSNVTVNESVLYVNESNTDDSDTYGTIQEAINNSANDTTISITPSTYNLSESLNVTSDNLAFVNNDPNTGDVEINATNTTSGDAFTGEFKDNIRVGQYILVNGEVFAGGGGGGSGSDSLDFLTDTFMGIPYWVIGIVVVAIGFLYSKEE